MTRYVCSKMFTDVNIRIPYNSLKNCCKTDDYEISSSELDSLIADGENVLMNNSEYVRRKESMVLKNELPFNGCNTCIHAEPHSLFRSWNIWDDNNRPSDNDLLTKELFTTYEFVLSSACDLKCVYCGAHDSSAWANELGVPVNKGNEKWKHSVLSQLIKHLKARSYDPNEDYWFFFSGGEPTYNPETLPLVQQIIDIVPHANIIITTNANTKSKVMDRYIDTIRRYPHINWIFDCSVDGVGQRAEAIRYGLDWEKFNRNLERIVQEPNAKIRISPTMNIYGLPTMMEFVQYFHEFFVRHGQSTKQIFNFNMVQETPLSPWSIPAHYAELLDPSIEYCRQHNLSFDNHLKNVKQLIGSKIDHTTADKIQRQWEYFQRVRPETDWVGLFPHVPEIIKELKNENTDLRK